MKVRTKQRDFPFDTKRFILANGLSYASLLTILPIFAMLGRGAPVVSLIHSLLPGYTPSIWGSILGFGYGMLFGSLYGHGFVEMYKFMKGKV